MNKYITGTDFMHDSRELKPNLHLIEPLII